MNVADYLIENSRAEHDVALLTLGGNYSYRELFEAVRKVAGFLIDSGAQKGDRILLLAENSFFWVASYLGTLKAGCVSVPVAPNISGEDLKYIVYSCGINIGLLHGRVTRDQVLAFPSGCKIVLEDAAAPFVGLPCKFVLFQDLLTLRLLNATYPEIDEKKDLAAIMFTSGSTAKPRGVMITHLNIIANTSSILQYLALTAQDRIMVVIPFYYCFGTSLLHTHLRVGGSLVIDPRFMFADKVLVRMQETRCTGFAGVPSHYQILLRKSSLKKMLFPTLRYVQQAGGRLADTLIQDLCETLRTAKVFIMYGQTEGTARLSYLPPELVYEKLGSIGKGIPGTQLRVVDQYGAEVSPGEIGEIIAQGDNVALGYWDARGEYDSTFRNGYLYTGDLARIDEDGYIFIVDRNKDILKCGGKRSSCKEVEDALLECQGLVEVAVIGVWDEELGEAVKAFVVPQKRNGDFVGYLRAFCSRRLPSHLIPREIVVLEELPKNGAGKILKPALKLMS